MIKVLSGKDHKNMIDTMNRLAAENDNIKEVLRFDKSLNRKSKGSSGKSSRKDHISNLTGVTGVTTFNEMARSDDGVARVLRAYFGHLKQAEWKVRPFDVNYPESVKRAEETQDALFNYSKPFIDVLNDILGYVRVGFSVFEPEYKLMATKYGLRYVLNDWGWRAQDTLYNWLMDGGTVKKVDQMYYDPIEQNNTYEELQGKDLIIFSHDKEGNNIFGDSFLRPIYGNFLRKQEFYENMMIGIEKAAMGIPHVETPEGLTNDSDADKVDDYMASYCVNEKSYIRTPAGYKINVVDIKYDADKVMAAIGRENSMMLRASLLEFLDFGQDGNGSSFALNESRAIDFINRLSGYSMYICHTINHYVIKKLEYNNYGITEGFSEMYAEGIRERITLDFANMIKALAEAGFVKPDSGLRSFFRRILNFPEEIAEEIENAGKDDSKNADSKEDNVPVDDENNEEDADMDDKKELAAEKKFDRRHNPKTIGKDYDLLESEYNDLIEKNGTLIKTKLLADIKKAVNTKNPLGEVNKIKPGYVNSLKLDIKNFIIFGIMQGKNQANKEMKKANVLASADDLTPDVRKWVNATAETSADFISKGIRDTAIVATIKDVNASLPEQKILFDAETKAEEFISNGNKNGRSVLVASSVSKGRDEVFKHVSSDENPIVGWEYIAVLDNNTTDICRWLNSRRVKANDPNAERYSPPNHYNCRSYKIPIFKKDGVENFNGWDVPGSYADQKTLDGLHAILKKAVLL